MSTRMTTDPAHQRRHAPETSDPAQEEMRHFIRALSHDLSANFMMIDHCFRRLAAEVAVEGSPAICETTEHLGVCLRQSRQFLNDLVTLAKTGTVDMQSEEVDLGALLEEVLTQQRELLARRGIRVVRDLAVANVACNRRRVHQVITNLVRNAAKHGCDARDPRIVISTRQGVASPLLVELRVRDNGPGIPEAYRHAIFEPGERLPNTQADGSGMGLAIVDKIARYYGQRACIEPTDSGTTVLVALPAVVAVADEQSAAVEACHNSATLGQDAPHRDQPRHPHSHVSNENRRMPTGRRPRTTKHGR